MNDRSPVTASAVPLLLRFGIGLLVALPLFSQPRIVTTSLPLAFVGQSYSTFLFGTGGTPPYLWAATTALPTGLTLNSLTGQLSGTPAVAGVFTVSFQLTDSKQAAAFASFSLTVNPSVPLSITTVSSLVAGSVGIPYSQFLSASGGTPPYTWSILSGNTGGLILDAGTGLIHGTPQTAGTFSFVVRVQDIGGATVSQTFSVVVSAPNPSITVVSTLPPAIVGTAYSQPFPVKATGGTPPYRWSLSGGSTPVPGMTFDLNALTISGTPTNAGTFNIAVQVTDANQITATGSFSLTVNPAPLTITTVAPLFAGTIGVAYSQPFAASGGKPPYTWSVSSGDTGGLTLDASTGTLHGTPQTAGTLTFVVKVADTAGASFSQTFSVIVSAPTLSIAVASSLPPGAVGVPYNQKLSVTAVGGTPPYTWSLPTGGLPAGLNLDLSALVISGTPTTAGTFNFTLQVTDSNNQTSTKSLSLTIAPPSLSITTNRQLPDGSLNAAYTTTLAAQGGTPPYTWSAVGLPAGLSINSSSGVISGVATGAGNFGAAITVTDSSLASVSDRFTLNINLPATPGVSISGLPNTAAAAQQYTIQVALVSAFPAAISGQAILTFSPDSGPTDQTVQFAAGGTTASFSIPAGATTATSTVPLALQTGTTAGTISVSLRLQAGGIDITPVPAPSMSTQIAAAAPVITKVQTTTTSGSISIMVWGYSTAREVSQATFGFGAASGQTLQSSASSIAVSIQSLFSTWFQNPANSPYGSQFVLTQPFSVQGDSSAVVPQSVTLSNRIGSTTYTIH